MLSLYINTCTPTGVEVHGLMLITKSDVSNGEGGFLTKLTFREGALWREGGVKRAFTVYL